MERGGSREPVEAALARCLAAARADGAGGVLVAYSAGPDSTALLAAAAALRAPGLAAAYIDHGIRPADEREAELALARRVCARLGVPLSVARLRPGAVEALSRREGIGIEAAARRRRYRALRDIMSRRGSSLVLTAHNLDDQVETALMRFLGGSGSGGLRGIPASNGPFLRPFLRLPKAALLAYVGERGLEYSIDSTNALSDYRRNRLRHNLAPALDAAFPGWRRGVLLAADKAALEEEALAAAGAGLAFAPEGPSAASADAASLLAAPRALALRAVVEAAGRLLGRDRASARLAAAALDSLSRGKAYRGGGLELRAEAGRARLSVALDFPARGGYFVIVDGPCRVRAGNVVVSASWADEGDRGLEARGIRAAAFSFPLAVRSRRPGDSIALPRGSKRLDVLLSEMGLPPALRDLVPVVEDRDGIVAVLGSAFGAADRHRHAPGGAAGRDERHFAIDVKGA